MSPRLAAFLAFSLHLLSSSPHLSFAGAPNTLPDSACAAIKSKIGQLLYLSVDGYAYDGPEAIHPDYVKLIKEINPGGVLPHLGKRGYASATASIAALQNAARDPLLVGIDFESIDGVTFGLGWGGGSIAEFNPKADIACIQKMSYLAAFLHRAAGINQALGPTIERHHNWGYLDNPPEKIMAMADPLYKSFRHFGVATTMKHFPYTPDTFNLHQDNKDTRIPAEKVREMLQVFKQAAQKNDFAMTTHLLNTNIDPDNMATFSKKWVSMLRKDSGFDGILMTDALFMISHYAEAMKSMARKWDAAQASGIDDPETVFAVRAILAGHDMVFLDGTAASHRKVYKNLATIACLDTALGAELRARVNEAAAQIAKYKSENGAVLRASAKVPKGLFDQAGRFYERLVLSSRTGGSCADDEFAALKASIENLGLPSFPGAAAPNFATPNPDCTADPKSLQPIDPNQIGPLYKVRDAVFPQAEQHDFEDH